MRLDPEKLRIWVYDALVRPRNQFGANSSGLQLTDISNWVKQKAQQAGTIEQDTPFSKGHLEKADEDAIRECIWGLIIQGLVVPGAPGISSDAYGSNLPWLQVTEWGKTCLEKGEYVPYDAGLFLSRLRAQIPALDPVIELYLKEALISFRSGCYLSTAVMIGVASERVLILMRDAIHAAIAQQDGKKKFIEKTENQIAKRIYEAVKSKIDPVREQLPAPLPDSIGTALDGIFAEVRQTRNDAGHPTGRVVDREEAYALLQLFPVYARSGYALLAWLGQNPL
jgi:hypothetical protein